MAVQELPGNDTTRSLMNMWL